jgi:UDP-N-acetylmuramoyl-L-alanyl-D-glutamate--2,6-diaminopimelate ligase
MGSLGKTNTAMLTTAALDAHGCNVAVASSLGVFDGVGRRDIDIRLCGPSGLARWLAESVAVGCTHAVLEIPADPRWSDRLAGLQFDTLCLTNIIDDDRYDPWGDVPASDWLPRQVESLTPEAVLVFNADDAPARRLADESGRPALAVGSDDTSQLVGTLLETHIGEQTFLLSAGNTSVPLQTPLSGQFQLHNCLLAAGIALVDGGDVTTAVRGLETVRIVPGRLEPISCGQAFVVYVDAAPTLDALEHALDSVRPLAGGRLICGLVSQSGPVAQLDLASRTMRRFVALAEAECETVVAGRLEEVAERALSAAEPGDCVLITRCGRLNLTSRVAIGEDSQRVRDWLYANQSQPQPAASWS